MRDQWNRPQEEQRYSQEWVMFGGNPGLKTHYLLNFQARNPSGCVVLPGISIGTEYFDEFVRINNLSLEQVIDNNRVMRAKIPRDLREVNSQIILHLTPGRPYAVRSSATDEKGGSGLYETDFFVPTGDVDHDQAMLAYAEKVVYESMFFQRANTHRRLQEEQIHHSMGILIQPVVGDKIGEHFFPLFSGVLTYLNNEPYLRFSRGLGISVVDNSPDSIALRGEEITAANISAASRYLDRIQAVDLTKDTSPVWPFHIGQIMQDIMNAHLYKVENLVEAWREMSSERGVGYYLEFAIDLSASPAIVIQAAPEKLIPREFVSLYKELGPALGRVLFVGDDVVNVGKREGRGILWLGRQGDLTPADIRLLKRINETQKDFLLVIPDKAFTFRGEWRKTLGIEYFGNAAGIIEIKYPGKNVNRLGAVSHFKQKIGGTHFAEVCKKIEILYLGHDWISDMPLQRLGLPADIFDQSGSYFDLHFAMTNTLNGGRVELIANENN